MELRIALRESSDCGRDLSDRFILDQSGALRRIVASAEYELEDRFVSLRSS
jgi:hypothetical protein